MKKIYAILIGMIMSVALMFSGCDLVELNQNKFLNDIVVTVKVDKDTKIEITREKYLQFYTNYASSYVQNGMSIKEAAQTILDTVINRELLLNTLKNEPEKLVGNNESDLEAVTINQNNENAAMQAVFDYIVSQLQTYEKEVRSDWDIDAVTSGEDEAKTPATTKKVYEKKYELVGGELVKIADEEEVIEPKIVNPFLNYFWSESEVGKKGFTGVGTIKSKLIDTSNGVKEEAMKRFVADLKKAEEYKKLKNNTPIEILQREIDRAYEINLDNQYVTKYQNWYDNRATFTADQVVDYMKNLITTQEEKYFGTSGEEKYNQAMKSDSTTVYYHANGDWFNVAHVLIGYSDEQKAQITELKTKLENGTIDQQAYDDLINDINANTVGQAKDSEGYDVGEPKTAENILVEIQNAINSCGSDAVAKAKKFDEFNYKYSTDTGFMNRDYDYAIPADSTYDSMIKAFADESRVLREEGLCSMSGLVWGEYGAHIIMYTGDITPVNNNADTLTIEQMNNKTLKMSSDKTLMDLVIDKLTVADYATYQASIMQQLREKVDIKIYTDKLKQYFNA